MSTNVNVIWTRFETGGKKLTRLFTPFLKLVQLNFIFANNIAYIIHVL